VCLTFNICLHRLPSSDTDCTRNLARPCDSRKAGNCARTPNKQLRAHGEPVVIRLPAAAKSIVSDRTSSTRRRPDRATRRGLLSVKVEGKR